MTLGRYGHISRRSGAPGCGIGCDSEAEVYRFRDRYHRNCGADRWSGETRNQARTLRPGLFAQERAKIVAALGVKAIRVGHVGSTSVPGLAAKPIIDIELSVNDIDDEEHYLPTLLEVGYHLRVREPGHRVVRTADQVVHIHCCTTGIDWASAALSRLAASRPIRLRGIR